MRWQRKKPREELNDIKPKFHEATDAEETEEFSLLADVFAPQFLKRVQGNSGCIGKRVHLTAADKKKVNKASIGLPIPRTLKLFIFNTRPFILEFTLPLEEFCKRYPGHLSHVRFNPEFKSILPTRHSHSHSAPAVQQRISLSGDTLYSRDDQQIFAALPDLPPSPSEDPQNRQISSDVDVPVPAEPEPSNLVSDLVIDEDVWDLIERSARQRKSRLRQLPNTMSIETNNTSIRGSNNTRLSVSYPRPGESSHTSTNPIKDQPGTSARRPKSMPSGSQLPPCWNDEMDEFICHMEAQCEFSTRSMVRALKQRFAGLREVGALFFSFELWRFMLTLLLACDSGRGNSTSHRHP